MLELDALRTTGCVLYLRSPVTKGSLILKSSAVQISRDEPLISLYTDNLMDVYESLLIEIANERRGFQIEKKRRTIQSRVRTGRILQAQDRIDRDMCYGAD